jgi:diadenosine tetraphosphate (Ap4A) HIT family hydrolase
MTDDWKTDRMASALRGENPTVLRRLDSGFAIIGDLQFLPGYCVLMTDTPGVERLSDLPRPRRMEFLADLDLLTEVVERVCTRHDSEFRRANLMILGNFDPFLHAHVIPRYHWEPAEFQPGPSVLYPEEQQKDPARLLGPQHDALRADLIAEIDRMRAATHT